MSSLKTGVLFVALAYLSACGRQIVEFKQDAGPDAAAAPTVIFAVPAHGVVGVARDSTVSATFSKPMDGATITMVTFTVTQGTTPVQGGVTFDGPSRTALFIPNAPLGANLVYTATVTIGARDTGGLALAADKTWTFTTSAAFNTSRPTVIFTSPARLATNVPIPTRPTATFNKAMDPATISLLTFKLALGATPVLGTVTYDAPTNTAMFAPTNPLELSREYMATITTGARDAGGSSLVVDYTWTFTTGACSERPVDLGAAGNFAALAGSTVTNTGPSVVVGDLGVSPNTAVSGFPPGVLVGTQHTGDPTSAAAMAALTTAYNEVSIRMLCSATLSGNTGGMTLAPGLYHSGSSLSISSGDLTLDAQGDSDAMFIFTMMSTLTTTSGRQVILANGAKASNIFWQVGSSATLGTNSVFYGTIMADQSITLGTGAALNGRALARIGAVNLDNNAVAMPVP